MREIVSPLSGFRSPFGARRASASWSPGDLPELQVLLDPSDLSTLFQDTAKTNPVTAGGQLIACVANKSVGGDATQSSSSFRPIFRDTVAGRFIDFDGLDDRLVGTVTPGTGNFSIAAKAMIPANPAGRQVIVGTFASNLRCLLSVESTGMLSGGVGNLAPTILQGASDIRGQTGVAMMVVEGSTVALFWNNVVQYTGAWTGTLPTSAFFYGAVNSNGTAANFYNGEIGGILISNAAFTAAERGLILDYWS